MNFLWWGSTRRTINQNVSINPFLQHILHTWPLCGAKGMVNIRIVVDYLQNDNKSGEIIGRKSPHKMKWTTQIKPIKAKALFDIYSFWCFQDGNWTYLDPRDPLQVGQLPSLVIRCPFANYESEPWNFCFLIDDEALGEVNQLKTEKTPSICTCTYAEFYPDSCKWNLYWLKMRGSKIPYLLWPPKTRVQIQPPKIMTTTGTIMPEQYIDISVHTIWGAQVRLSGRYWIWKENLVIISIILIYGTDWTKTDIVCPDMNNIFCVSYHYQLTPKLSIN